MEGENLKDPEQPTSPEIDMFLTCTRIKELSYEVADQIDQFDPELLNSDPNRRYPALFNPQGEILGTIFQ